MQYFQGKSVYKGIVMGPVAVLKKNDYQVKRARIEDSEAEVKRVKEAVEVSKKQLGRLYDKAVREVGEASAAIFEVHQMMLEDEDYLESMENMIRTELVNAEYAAAATGDNFAEMFAAMDDEYMKARSADVKDISERLVRNLSGEGDNDLSSMEPSVIVADDLSPSETVQMDKEKILAFVTVHGSTNSHTAILARMMNIPALIGVPMDLNGLKTGMTAVVDGFSGQVIFEPEEDVRKETEKRMQEEAEKQFYVNTTAKPVQKDTQDNKDNKDTDEGKDTGKGNGAGSASDTSYQTPDAGGYSNGEAAYSGGAGGSTDGDAASGNGSVPRVIVTGFTTDPAEVRAGSNFKLTIHLKNTSRMKVSNMLFDLSAPTEGSDEQTTSPAFLPSSGASSIPSRVAF